MIRLSTGPFSLLIRPRLCAERRRTYAIYRAQRNDTQWTCVEGCGACCQLDKGALAPPIESILKDPAELQVSPSLCLNLAETPALLTVMSLYLPCANGLQQLYYDMVGPDGWCKHFNKQQRSCNIYRGMLWSPQCGHQDCCGI